MLALESLHKQVGLRGRAMRQLSRPWCAHVVTVPLLVLVFVVSGDLIPLQTLLDPKAAGQY
jgi:hypothetical protein